MIPQKLLHYWDIGLSKGKCELKKWSKMSALFELFAIHTPVITGGTTAILMIMTTLEHLGGSLCRMYNLKLCFFFKFFEVQVLPISERSQHYIVGVN